MLEPSQQLLPDEVRAELKLATSAEKQGTPAAVVTHLRRAVALASEAGYL
jgi:hypothetical protein